MDRRNSTESAFEVVFTNKESALVCWCITVTINILIEKKTQAQEIIINIKLEMYNKILKIYKNM